MNILKQLIENNSVWIEGQEYVGRASDGTVVGLGMVGYEQQLIEYLTERPFPSMW